MNLGNDSAAPPNVIKTQRPILAVIVGIVGASVFLLLGIGLLVLPVVISALEWQHWQQLDTSGLMTVGECIDRYSMIDEGTDDYTIGYRFYHNGREYTGFAYVSESDYRNIAIGDPLPIFYSTEDPTISELRDTKPSIAAPMAITLFAVVWVVLLSVYFFRRGKNRLKSPFAR